MRAVDTPLHFLSYTVQGHQLKIGDGIHQLAAQWIVKLLNDRSIPFLICGGLAAKGYGSERELNDIDLFVPGKYFSSVVQAGKDYVSKPAAHRQEEGWDVTYVQSPWLV